MVLLVKTLIQEAVFKRIEGAKEVYNLLTSLMEDPTSLLLNLISASRLSSLVAITSGPMGSFNDA
jgi:hypothetical protein